MSISFIVFKKRRGRGGAFDVQARPKKPSLNWGKFRAQSTVHKTEITLLLSRSAWALLSSQTDVLQTAQSTDHNTRITLLLSSGAWVLLSSPIDVLQTAQSTDHNTGITQLLSSSEWVLLSSPIDVL